MPISKENKGLYPQNWPEIRDRIRTRAGDRCEACHIKNHTVGLRLRDGNFRHLSRPEWDMVYSRIRHQESSMTESLKHFGYMKIVCTVAHLDHNPANCREVDLRFWCQRCHNQYDRKHRDQTIRNRRLKNQLKLFQ
jgi:hypothetical protein